MSIKLEEPYQGIEPDLKAEEENPLMQCLVKNEEDEGRVGPVWLNDEQFWSEILTLFHKLSLTRWFEK